MSRGSSQTLTLQNRRCKECVSLSVSTLSISLQKDLLHVTFVKSGEKKGAIGAVFTLLSRNTSEKVRTTACSRQASRMWRTDVNCIYISSRSTFPLMNYFAPSITQSPDMFSSIQILITDACLCSVPNTYHG